MPPAGCRAPRPTGQATLIAWPLSGVVLPRQPASSSIARAPGIKLQLLHSPPASPLSTRVWSPASRSAVLHPLLALLPSVGAGSCRRGTVHPDPVEHVYL